MQWPGMRLGEGEVDAIQLALRKRNYRGLCKQPGIFADFHDLEELTRFETRIGVFGMKRQ